jgi:hypothetical protein
VGWPAPYAGPTIPIIARRKKPAATTALHDWAGRFIALSCFYSCLADSDHAGRAGLVAIPSLLLTLNPQSRRPREQPAERNFERFIRAADTFLLFYNHTDCILPRYHKQTPCSYWSVVTRVLVQS